MGCALRCFAEQSFGFPSVDSLVHGNYHSRFRTEPDTFIPPGFYSFFNVVQNNEPGSPGHDFLEVPARKGASLRQRVWYPRPAWITPREMGGSLRRLWRTPRQIWTAPKERGCSLPTTGSIPRRSWKTPDQVVDTPK